MTFIHYQDFNFRKSTLDLIAYVNAVLDEYGAAGYVLTLRQVYYQLVQANIIPNSEKSYDALGVTVKKGRLAGLISWTAIEDRNRGISPWLIQPDQLSVVDGLEAQLAYDLWTPQNAYVEVWIEKDALSSVIERPCARFRVPFMPCKGYLSTSEIWRAGQRFGEAMEAGKRCVMIHLGDHDPSGWDMTRDNEARLELIAGMGVDVQRIALNTDQVKRFNLPPNPAKRTDKRFAEYARQYGTSSWELDALKPQFLDEQISEAVKGCISDADAWEAVLAAEAKEREPLKLLHGRWGDVKRFLMEPPAEPPAYLWEPD